MEAKKVGTVSGFKFEVSGSLLETRNLEPETRNVSDFLRSHLTMKTEMLQARVETAEG